MIKVIQALANIPYAVWGLRCFRLPGLVLDLGRSIIFQRCVVRCFLFMFLHDVTRYWVVRLQFGFFHLHCRSWLFSVHDGWHQYVQTGEENELDSEDCQTECRWENCSPWHGGTLGTWHLALGTLGPPSILGVGGRDYVENAEQTLFITWLQLHGELLCCRSVFQNLLQHPITVRQFIDHFPRVAKQNLIFFKSVHMIVICWGEQVARAKDLFVLNENYGFSMRAIPQLIFPGQICQMTDIPVLLVGMGNEIWNFSRFMNEAWKTISTSEARYHSLKYVHLICIPCKINISCERLN